MKKFLAVSFFCAVAAFGFGASNTWAAISGTQKANYTDVKDAKTSSNQISALNDSSDLDEYYEDGDVLYYSANGSNDAMAYALKRTLPGTPVAKTNLEIDTNKTVNNNKVNKIHTQLIDDGVTDLTIKGYTNIDGTGNVTVSGTTDRTKQFDTLTVLKADGNAVDQTTLNNAKTYFTTTKVVAKNVKTLTDNTDTGDNNGGTGTGDSGAGETSDSGSSNGNGSGSSESGSGNESDGNNPETETGGKLTPATVTSTKLEYESGKTTWGDLLVKAGVNTTDDATGVWKVKAGSLSGDLVNYGEKKDGSLSSTPMESGLESAIFTYVHGENDKFSDSGDIQISLKDIAEDVDDVDNEKFGEQQIFGDQKFYVNDETGETSAVITAEKNKITWLRESSDGTAAWYGFNNNSSENSQAALPDGSIVSVNWISREKNPEEFDKKIKEVIDGNLQSLGLSVEDNKIWLFELNAYTKSKDADGKISWKKAEAADFKDKMEVYIELGDDWDLSDVNTIWLDNKEKLTTPSIITKEINGVSKRFAVFKLDHFSTYAIYDEQKINDIFDKLQKISDEAQAKYLKENPNATKTELETAANNAMEAAIAGFSKSDQEELIKYYKYLESTFGATDKEDTSSTSSQNSSNKSTSNSSSTGISSSSTGYSSLDSTNDSSNSSLNSSSSSYSSKIKTGKNENLSLLLFLLSTGGILSLNAICKKKVF